MPQDQLKQQIEMFGELIKEFGDLAEGGCGHRHNGVNRPS